MSDKGPITLNLKLGGAMKGKTIVLAGVQFKDGQAVIKAPEEEAKNLARYLERCYQAEVDGEAAAQQDASLQEIVDSAKQGLEKVTQERDNAVKELEDTKKSLAQSNEQVAKLTTDLEKASTDAEESKKALEAANKEIAKLKKNQ